MSIATRTGDLGSTALTYNRRVPKNHPRVEAYGAVDELNAALGLARASSPPPCVNDALIAIQGDLVTLMGELATDPADLGRYRQDGFGVVTADHTAKLDRLVLELESPLGVFKGWATPGPPPPAAAIEMARTICRRAERRVCALRERNQLPNKEIIAYLNRLADVLWLLARSSE